MTVLQNPARAARDVAATDLALFVRGRDASGNERELSWRGMCAPMYADHTCFEDEAATALARTEPDEALVACIGEGRDLSCTVLASTGVNFHWANMSSSANDYLYGQGMAPGLWVFENAKMWAYTSHEGEHDSGLDGDWRPATLDDVERLGFTLESLEEELTEALDGEPLREGLHGPGLARHLMDLSAAYVSSVASAPSSG